MLDDDWAAQERSRDPRGILIALGALVSFFVLTELGDRLYLTGLLAVLAAMVPLSRRWGLSWLWPSAFFVIVWPATVLFSYFLVRTQERERRERIVREVMEE